ncbi:hypothetical protein [Agromyces sp. NPDC058126]|uniref:hypothetical protein n=1 Tax=Agromyces sp. NPDC058126 TaxID=3346350 RepID=UPI0036DB1E90
MTAKSSNISFPASMVIRYEHQVATHPPIGPLTLRQDTELQNLAHWRRRAIGPKTGHLVSAGWPG